MKQEQKSTNNKTELFARVKAVWQGRSSAEVYKSYKKQSQFADVWRRFKKNKLAVFGLVLLVVLIAMAVFADVICDFDTQVIAQNYKDRLLPPSMNHFFGTDSFGRDIFYRIVHGARLSLSIGIITIASSMIGGLILGSVSGFYGGIVDNIIMRIVDIFLAIPPLLLAVAVVAVLGPSYINLVIALSVGYIPFFARVVRAPLLQIKDKEFIEAARAAGTSDFKIITKHIMPNIIAPIVVQGSMGVGDAIKTAASLSFIGLGIQPPSPEWGTMLSEGKDYIRDFPHLVIFPGLFIAAAILSLNLIGDGLQDALDPKLKN